MAEYYEGLAEGEDQAYEAYLFVDNADRLIPLPPAPAGTTAAPTAPAATSTTPTTPAATFTAKEQKEYRNILKEQFRLRARAARELASTYNALGRLASYDASTEVQTAAGALATELQGLGALPADTRIGLSQPVSVTGLSSLASGLIIDAKQSRSIRKGGRAIKETLKNWQVIADGESRAYAMRSTHRLGYLYAMTNHLRRSGQFEGNELFEDAFKLFRIRLNPGGAPPTEAQLSVVRPILLERYVSLKSEGEAASQFPSRALQKLLLEHEKFEEKKPLTLGELTAELNRFNEMLQQLFPDL